MRKTFRPNVMILGLTAMIAIIVAIAWAQGASTVSPDPKDMVNRCSACHEMAKEVSAWRQSSHKDVACTECHAGPGLQGWVHQQVANLRMNVAAGEGQSRDGELVAKVPNERCMACHARDMPFVMQDLKPFERDEAGQPTVLDKSKLAHLPAAAGHDLHLTMENPLSCQECHRTVSHGPAPEKRVNRVETMHQVCLDCHAREQVTMQVSSSLSCSACHLELEKVTPGDHRSAAFRKGHGDAAKSDIATCQQCHLNPGIDGQAAALGPHGAPAGQAQPAKVLPVAGTKPLAIPTLPPGSIVPAQGVKDTCVSCHGLTMPHPSTWLGQHAKGFKEKPELCASCHGTVEQGFAMTAASNPRSLPTENPQCISCHVQPVPHPQTWVEGGHSAAAQSRPLSCQLCHSANNPVNPGAPHTGATFCLDCHESRYAHPDGWVASHKLAIASAGGNQTVAGCTQCHTPTRNACTACHTSGVGVMQQWHPNLWWVSHARTAKPNDPTCARCHDSVQPSCSQCHARY